MANILIRLLSDNKDALAGIDEVESRYSRATSALANTAKLGGLAAGAALGASFISGLNRDAFIDQLGGTLDISDAQMADIGSRASNIYSENWGESFEAVAMQMAEFERGVLGATTSDSSALTANFLAFTDSMEIDGVRATETLRSAMESGLFKTSEEGLDAMVRSMQGVPTELRGDVLDAMNEYGQFFAAMGLNGETMLAGFTNAAQGGAFELDKYGDAMKELTIRGTDMSSASQEAFALMGKDAKLYADLLLEGGDAAADATFGIARGLLAIEDPVDQANAAIALFGTPLEDMATKDIPAFLESIGAMTGGLEGSEGAAQRLAGQVGGNALNRLGAFRRKGMERLTTFVSEHGLPALNKVLDWAEKGLPIAAQYAGEAFDKIQGFTDTVVAKFREHWPEIKGHVDTAVDAIRIAADWLLNTAGPKVAQFVSYVVDNIQKLAQEHWPQIQEIFTDVADTVESVADRIAKIALWIADKVEEIWAKHGDTITAYASKAWDLISRIVGNALDVIQGVIKAIGAVMRGDWAGLWDEVKGIASAVWDNIKAIVGAALDVLKKSIPIAWGVIKTATSKAWDAIKGFIGDKLQDAKTAAATKLRELGDSIYNKFGEFKNWVRTYDFKSAARTAFTKILTGGQEVLSSIGVWMMGRLEAAYNAIINYGPVIYAAGKAAFLNIKSAIYDALLGVAGWISDNVLGPINSVFSAIQGIASAIPGVGSAIAAIPSIPTGGGSTVVGGGGSSGSTLGQQTAAQAQEQALLDAVIRARSGGGSTGSLQINVTNNGGGQTFNDNVAQANALGGIR